MNINALLNDAHRKLKISSDYALSKELGIPEQRLSDYRRGTRKPDTYALVRLALTVGRDPLEVIAEAEAETARSEVKRQFWRDFLQSVSRAGLRTPPKRKPRLTGLFSWRRDGYGGGCDYR